MSREYFLSPASKKGNESPFLRLQETVCSGFPPNELSQYTNVPLTNPVRVWGYRDGSKATWQQMDTGDTILFYTGDGYEYAARIRAKEQNNTLARKVWGLLEQGLGGDLDGDLEPWPNLVYLQNLRKLALPSAHLHDLLGYKQNHIPGIRRVLHERQGPVKQKYGSMDRLIVTFTREKYFDS